MSNKDVVREEIEGVISQNFGDKVGRIFSDAYDKEIMPIFLHNAFLLLKDLLGVDKARETLNSILTKHDAFVAYE